MESHACTESCTQQAPPPLDLGWQLLKRRHKQTGLRQRLQSTPVGKAATEAQHRCALVQDILPHCSSVRCASSMCLPAYDRRCRPHGMPLFFCTPGTSHHDLWPAGPPGPCAAKGQVLMQNPTDRLARCPAMPAIFCRPYLPAPSVNPRDVVAAPGQCGAGPARASWASHPRKTARRCAGPPHPQSPHTPQPHAASHIRALTPGHVYMVLGV